MNKPSVPRLLYKYRSFNANTLRWLSEAEMYYADPAGFNDPLDCKPPVVVDVDVQTLERLCYRMLVLAHDKESALNSMKNYRYLSTQFGDYKKDPVATRCYTGDLRREIEGLVHAEMRERGVVSLAARWNCPLMWSHYADEHRGLCIAYETHDHRCHSLRPVNYGMSGILKTSDIHKWKMEGSQQAEEVIRTTFFYSKARDWRYEREWRDVREGIGAGESTLKTIAAIYFGLRCDSSVITSVVKLFGSDSIRFFKIRRDDSSFRLTRYEIDAEEVERFGVRIPTRWLFDELDEKL